MSMSEGGGGGGGGQYLKTIRHPGGWVGVQARSILLNTRVLSGCVPIWQLGILGSDSVVG